ncbi:MAG: glycosyltransferase, partial [Candidatus Thorarchaeota archaeon]
LAGHPVVLYLGKLSILEGSELLKQIIQETCEALPDVRFLIIGSGPELESIQQFVRTRKLADGVHVLGWIDHSDVPDYINTADVCLFPRAHTSFSEYTSPENILKVSEYLAIGKPVIVPKMGGFKDASFPLIVVEPEEMASALIAYLKSPRSVESIGGPTWDVSHQRLGEVYRALGAIDD